jgi:N-methylhydantoinase B
MTTLGSSRLRDLGDAAMVERYGCDRFTATVLGNRFRYIVEQMCGRMLTAAFSPILRDFYDFAATISGPPSAGWPTPAMSNSSVLFTGTMADSVRNTVEEYGIDRLGPGDVIIANDPYRNGTHVNDILFARPVFHEGTLAGFVNLKAHQLDMGGVVPAGFSAVKHNVFENGLVISPRALYVADEPVPETWSLIFDNVRFGDILFPDMLTVCAELQRGERLLAETLERYGAEAVHGAMSYVCDAATEGMSVGLSAIADGEWVGESLIDCDGVDDTEEFVIRARVNKRGDRAEVDFSGSSRQARTCINATPLDVRTAVAIAFKMIFDPKRPFSSGTLGTIDIVLPEGSCISALPPDGAVFAYYEQSIAICQAVLSALSHGVDDLAIAGDRGGSDLHNANGVLPDGTPWISSAQLGGEIGGFGANRHGDADSQVLSYMANGIAPAIESVEAEVPAIVLRHEVVPDTGGAGTHRGGTSIMRDTLWLTPAQHYLMTMRYKRPTGFGARGGDDGITGGVWMWDDGEFDGISSTAPEHYRTATVLAGKVDVDTGLPDLDGSCPYYLREPFWNTPEHTVMRYRTNAGGGWGDPLERDPSAVCRDVRDEYLTIDGASRQYGVVVEGDPIADPEGLTIDAEATVRLRESMRAERSATGPAATA